MYIYPTKNIWLPFSNENPAILFTAKKNSNWSLQKLFFIIKKNVKNIGTKNIDYA